MNSISRKVFTVSLLIVLSVVTVGASLGQTIAATPLPDGVASDLVGTGAWRQFFAGVGCGAGVVLMASGYASGIGSIGALLLTGGTLQACATALNM